ncbi:MAG TPA: GNAT family N-acetyltransferase [Fimbriimonas sp.]
MRTSFRNSNVGALVELWNQFYPERYRIDEELFRLNTIESPLFDWGASSVEMSDGRPVGFVCVKRSAAGLFRGPDKDQSHLCAIAYNDPLVGIDLLGDAKTLLRNRGQNRLVFSQDIRHFFPGCPEDFRALHDFLTIEGFAEGGESVDLEGDLSSYSNPYPCPQGVEFRMLREADLASLEAFLLREFPGRWHYDVLSKARIEGVDNAVYGMLVDGKVEGFALLQDSQCKLPIGGAVWRNDLGEGWGSLGPIGVSQHLRGQGLGHALLGAALTRLKEKGARHSIIDWTNLVDYYGRHGFKPTRTYTAMSLKLD